MPAKKTRKSADGARYLLSADRKFRRLSLKKISERVKNAYNRALEDGQKTRDLGGELGTREFADAIMARLGD